MSKLTLRVLGGLSLETAGGRRLALPTRKAELLLSYLALSPGRAFSRGRLAAYLWPEADEGRASASLRKALSWIRAALPDGAISAERHQIWLSSHALNVDALQFEAAAIGAGIESLSRTASIYAGDLFDGVDLPKGPYEEWALIERERLRDRAIHALQRLCDLLCAAGEHGAAIDAAHRLIALDPFEECGHRHLIRMLVDEGQYRRARNHLESFKEMLRDELGIRPSSDLVAIVDPSGNSGHRPSSVRQNEAAGSLARAAVLPDLTTVEVPWLRAAIAGDGVKEAAQAASEELAKCLASMPDLRVIPPDRCGAEGFDSGSELRVEGALNRVGKVWHLAVNLGGPHGVKLWGECIECPFADDRKDPLLARVRGLSGRLAAAMAFRRLREVGLSGSEVTSSLLGQAASMMGCCQGESNQVSRGIFERLVQDEAENWMARALGGYCNFFNWYLLNDGLTDQPFAKALQMTERAVRLQPTAVLAREAYGWVLIKRERIREGLAHFRASIGLNPFDPTAWQGYGSALIEVGRVSEGLELLERCDGVYDIQNGGKNWMRAYAYFAMGAYAKAADVVVRSPGSCPNFEAWRAVACARAGREREAREHVSKFYEIAEAKCGRSPKRGPEQWLPVLLKRDTIARLVSRHDFVDALKGVGIR